MSLNVLECHGMLCLYLVQILLQRLQAAEHRRADLMSKIGETEFMIQNMEAQFKSAGSAIKEGAGITAKDAAIANGAGLNHQEHYEEV